MDEPVRWDTSDDLAGLLQVGKLRKAAKRTDTESAAPDTPGATLEERTLARLMALAEHIYVQGLDVLLPASLTTLAAADPLESSHVSAVPATDDPPDSTLVSAAPVAASAEAPLRAIVDVSRNEA